MAYFWRLARKWKFLVCYLLFGFIVFVTGRIIEYVKNSPEHAVSVFDHHGCCLQEPNFEGVSCQSQDDCGSSYSNFFCNYKNGEKTGTCKEVGDGSHLTFKSAQNWCESKSQKLYNSRSIQNICNTMKGGSYWLSDGRVLNAEKCMMEMKDSQFVADAFCKDKIENEDCKSQNDCGGADSRYFCNFEVGEKTGICENAGEGDYVRQDNAKAFLRKTDGIPLSFKSAQNWCESKGKKLFNLRYFLNVGKIEKGDYWLSNGGRLNIERPYEVIISEDPQIVANVLCKDKIKDEDCQSQNDCGGVDSRYFCNYEDKEKKGVCEEVGRSWRFEQEDSKLYRVKVGRPLLSSFKSAQNWCESQGMELYKVHDIQKLLSSVGKGTDVHDRLLEDALEEGNYWISDERAIYLDRNMGYPSSRTFNKQRGYYIYKVDLHDYIRNTPIFSNDTRFNGEIRFNKAICQEKKK